MNILRRHAGILALGLIGLYARAATTPTMPTFFARRDYPGLDSSFAQVADTNGDGIPDLIAILGGYVEVLFGNGDGTFGPGGANTLTAATGTVSFSAIDLDGDGAIDLVQANGNGVVVSPGNGDGTFQKGVLYPVSDSELAFLVVGDFNGDGKLDVAIAGTQGVWLLTGNGDGTLNPATLAVTLAGAFGIVAADFNGDQNLDLAVTLGTGFAVLLGNGNGTFQAPQEFTQPSDVIAIAAGPLSDGAPPSVAVAKTLSSTVYVYVGNGAGKFSAPKTVDLPGADRDGLALGDVNGDGAADLVTSNGYIAFGKGGGTFAAPVSYPIDGLDGPTNVVLADLRNDGLTDILTNGTTVSVLLSEGKGQFEDGIWTAVTGGAGCGATADFNGDGKPDLAVNNAEGVTILLGTGKASKPFTAGTPIALAGAGCLVTGDINGDGIPDLLVPVNGTVVAYLGSGNGTFTLAGTTAAPSGGYLALGDFNHDGKLDFATSGNLIAFGNGDGTFQAPTDIIADPPSTGFSNIASGDINNDGWTDLVLTNNAVPYNNVFVLLNNQTGGFTQVPTNFGELTNQAILVDLNGDGNLDLVLQYVSAGNSSVYLGNGTGEFSFKVELAGPATFPGLNMVADVNGDGIPDIEMLQGDTIKIYLGEGHTTYGTPFSIGTGPSPGDILVANLHGQTHKGLPDIVVPDGSGGVMVLTNLTK